MQYALAYTLSWLQKLGVGGSAEGGVASGWTVLDSDGNTFAVPLAVLDSDGNSFTVSSSVLDSDGNSFMVI